MDYVAIECPSGSHTVTQVTNCVILRIEVEHLPGSIVIQHKFSAGHILLRALRSLGEGFVRAAIIVYDDAGPRPGIWIIGLASHGEPANKKQCHHANYGETRSHHVTPRWSTSTLFDRSTTVEHSTTN